MNKISRRSASVYVFLGLLLAGFLFFLVEFSIKSPQWVVETGSPHIYEENHFVGGSVIDRTGMLLLEMGEDGWTYSTDLGIRQSTLHWVGDREGQIAVPAVPSYYGDVIPYDFFNGLYAYGGIKKDGGLIQLTLSAQVQKTALEAMGDHKGTVAVYNYKTGEILCAITTPTYDPDNVPDILGDPVTYEGAYMNRFLQASYPPGSIFKTVTLAAALEHLPNAEDLSFTCTGSWGGGEFPITCERAHGNQTLKDAFRNSCNCAFGELAKMLGAKTLLSYVEKYQLLDPVEFDGIKTKAGYFQQAPNHIELAQSAIGQYTDLVNPCAFMTFMGAIAGDGTAANPYVVASADDGQQGYKATTTQREAILSPEIAAKLREYMRNNVQQKYGDDNFPGLTVCAKTGTAELDGDKASYAMFSGFTTNGDLPLAFIICVEEGGYGQHTAIPIASKVLTACKEVLS